MNIAGFTYAAAMSVANTMGESTQDLPFVPLLTYFITHKLDWTFIFMLFSFFRVSRLFCKEPRNFSFRGRRMANARRNQSSICLHSSHHPASGPDMYRLCKLTQVHSRQTCDGGGRICSRPGLHHIKEGPSTSSTTHMPSLYAAGFRS